MLNTKQTVDKHVKTSISKLSEHEVSRKPSHRTSWAMAALTAQDQRDLFALSLVLPAIHTSFHFIFSTIDSRDTILIVTDKIKTDIIDNCEMAGANVSFALFFRRFIFPLLLLQVLSRAWTYFN